MVFSLWRKSSLSILSENQKKRLESDLKNAAATIQATIKYHKLNSGGQRINLPQYWTEWDGNRPTQILYDECYIEGAGPEKVSKKVYLVAGKAFEDLSDSVNPLHILFFVGEHSKKQLKETIRIVVLPSYQNQIPTYKAVGYLESRQKDLSVLAKIINSKSIVSTKFFLEMIEFAKDILRHHFPPN
ncbi:MAG: hypothetical protein AABX04_03880 [Nanoarchaeota archaeon]